MKQIERGMMHLIAPFSVFVMVVIVGGSAYAQEVQAERAETVAIEPEDGARAVVTDEPSTAPTGEATEADTDETPATTFKRNTVREFFDEQSNKTWQYIKPYILLRTGGIYEQNDNHNRVLREAGFKLWDAQFGFTGHFDAYNINEDWQLKIGYKLTANLAHINKVLSDAYIETEVSSFIFGLRLRVGSMKVPFLWSELQSDGKLYFYDRPQYVSPNKYIRDSKPTLGLGRNAGATLKLGWFDDTITIEGGVFSPGDSKEETWEVMIYVVRAELSSRDWINENVRLELGSGFFYQEKLPNHFENSRYALSGDLRLSAYGAFLGAEVALQAEDDQANWEREYEPKGFRNAWTRQLGYQVFAGYSFPHREYELALRWQTYDPDDTNLLPPTPQSGNQSLGWLTVSASWWPIDLLRVMVNYTHKWEFEPESGGFQGYQGKSFDNDTVVFMLQVSL